MVAPTNYRISITGSSYNISGVVSASPLGSSGNVYQAYDVSGTVNGEPIIGISQYGSADNLLFHPGVDSPGDHEFDYFGLGFATASASYNVFYSTPAQSYEVYSASGSRPVQLSLTPVCFVSGTRILTIRGSVAVEDLTIGDLVTTASGAHRAIRWIGHRSYAGRFANSNPDILPVCLKAGSLADGVPHRDLWVSPAHAIFLDGALIPAEFLVNGASVTKAERVDSVTYWHIELDSHDVLVAEGALAESYVNDDNRGFFHNAESFHALYPEVDAGASEAVYCAPRLENGFQLEAVRNAIAMRAGVAAAIPDCGPLQGSVDLVEGDTLRGWACNASNPTMSVCLDLVVEGRVISQGLANRRRCDLDNVGHGLHGFEFRLPANLSGDRIAICRSADGARLEMMNLAA